MTAPVRLIAIALAMTGMLVVMAAGHALQRAGGEEVRLEMTPIDPRDLLLGHYATLATPLHRLDLTGLTDTPGRFERGDSIYVTLVPDETGTWQAARVHDRHPGEGVVMRGMVRHADRLRDRRSRRDGADGDDGVVFRHHVSVHYNLERYYAAHQDALALEHLRDQARMRLIVSVSRSGAAVIKGLEIDGEDRLDRLF